MALYPERYSNGNDNKRESCIPNFKAWHMTYFSTFSTYILLCSLCVFLFPSSFIYNYFLNVVCKFVDTSMHVLWGYILSTTAVEELASIPYFKGCMHGSLFSIHHDVLLWSLFGLNTRVLFLHSAPIFCVLYATIHCSVSLLVSMHVSSCEGRRLVSGAHNSNIEALIQNFWSWIFESFFFIHLNVRLS